METLLANLAVYACYWLPIVILLVGIFVLVFRPRRNRQEQKTSRNSQRQQYRPHRTANSAGIVGAAVGNIYELVSGAAVGELVDWVMDTVWPDKRPECPNCSARLDSYVVASGRDKGEKKFYCRTCGFEGPVDTISPGA